MSLQGIFIGGSVRKQNGHWQSNKSRKRPMNKYWSFVRSSDGYYLYVLKQNDMSVVENYIETESIKLPRTNVYEGTELTFNVNVGLQMTDAFKQAIFDSARIVKYLVDNNLFDDIISYNKLNMSFVDNDMKQQYIDDVAYVVTNNAIPVSLTRYGLRDYPDITKPSSQNVNVFWNNVGNSYPDLSVLATKIGKLGNVDDPITRYQFSGANAVIGRAPLLSYIANNRYALLDWIDRAMVNLPNWGRVLYDTQGNHSISGQDMYSFNSEQILAKDINYTHFIYSLGDAYGYTAGYAYIHSLFEVNENQMIILDEYRGEYINCMKFNQSVSYTLT